VSSQLQSSEQQAFVIGLWGVQYQVTDVRLVVAFYTEQRGRYNPSVAPAFPLTNCPMGHPAQT